MLIMKRQLGLSLVEMMVSLAIGMVIMSGALYLSTTSMRVSRDNIRMSFLNQELSNAMNLITKDLRRASYWAGAVDATRVSSVATVIFDATSGTGKTLTLVFDPVDVSDTVVDSLGAQAKDIGAQLVYLEKDTTSPYAVQKYTATITGYDASTNAFTANLSGTFPATVLTAGGGASKGSWSLVSPSPVNTVTVTLSGNHCATFSYDANGNGQIDDGTVAGLPDERFGFRYDSVEQAIELRESGGACNATGWENITDENVVQIYSFTITNYTSSFSASPFTIDIREYSIEMKGRLVSDPSIERTLRETIRVRNDKVT